MTMKRSPGRPWGRKQKGQSLVEMGLTLIFLLWILAAAINFGLAYMAQVTIRDAAQEGAIFGALRPTEWGLIEDRVRSTASAVPVVDPNNFDIDISTPLGICPGNTIKVTVHYDFQLVMPFVEMFINNPIPMSTYATAEILRRVDESCPPYTGP